jgi:hypothetical protein
MQYDGHGNLSAYVKVTTEANDPVTGALGKVTTETTLSPLQYDAQNRLISSQVSIEEQVPGVLDHTTEVTTEVSAYNSLNEALETTQITQDGHRQQIRRPGTINLHGQPGHGNDE